MIMVTAGDSGASLTARSERGAAGAALGGRVLPHPLLQHPSTVGHQTSTGPRVSPPIDVRQGYPLLYMYLEPCILPYALPRSTGFPTGVPELSRGLAVLAEPPREQPHQVPVSKRLLAAATVSGRLVSADRMDPQVGWSPDGPSNIFFNAVPEHLNSHKQNYSQDSERSKTYHSTHHAQYGSPALAV